MTELEDLELFEDQAKRVARLVDQIEDEELAIQIFDAVEDLINNPSVANFRVDWSALPNNIEDWV